MCVVEYHGQSEKEEDLGQGTALSGENIENNNHYS